MKTSAKVPSGESPLHSDLKNSAMMKLSEHFNNLATGSCQVPCRSVQSHLRSEIHNQSMLDYHDRLVAGAGPLFSHFLASVPYILEELSRVGVALTHLTQATPQRASNTRSLFEIDAFDGSFGRALAGHSQGLIHSFTSSPNVANQVTFDREADRTRSKFFPQSFLHVTPSLLKTPELQEFSQGFDYIYEMAAFQFYSPDRPRQFSHIKQFLKPDGLAFFLEKFNHTNPKEYLLRENIKDDVFKTRYFSAEEIHWKRQQMLEQMKYGQVTLEDFVSAASAQFKHVHLLWNSSNFCEIVASDDAKRIEHFLDLLPPVVQPTQFCFEQARLGSLSHHPANAEIHK